MSSDTFPARLTSIHQMTPRVKQYVLRVDGHTFSYRPGQHITINFVQDGETVQRPYTPVNLPGTSALALAIKRYDDGTASVWMDECEMGDTIAVTEPRGNLYLRDTDRDVVFLSTGTGITPMIAMLKRGLAGLEGLSGNGVVTDRGIVKKTDFKGTDELSGQQAQMLGSIQQSVDQLALPLPEAAIGVGSRWRVVQDTTVSGMKQTTTYTAKLVERADGAARIELQAQVTAPEQDVELPTGMSAHLVSLSGEGEGEMLLKQGRLAPSRSRMSMSSEFTMAFAGREMSMTSKVKIQLTGK